ncbi:MarR family transcriptional regulator [Chloroflexi bacterium TSY]|nr:MarR family transcriptional regulator [Chloroflexi bacterium TSY]
MSTRYSGEPKEVRALDTYIKLLRATDSVKSRIDRYETTKELGATQFGTLEMLYHLGPLHQNEIGQKLLISKSNVVAVVDKLEKRGFVERHRSEEDRRCVFVHLTESGRAIVEKILPVHVAAITKEMSCLSLDEQRELGRLCRKLGLNERNRQEDSAKNLDSTRARMVDTKN